MQANVEVVELLLGGESQVLEFKSSVNSPRLMSRLIAAFANASGGRLVIGINEPDGSVKSVEPGTLDRIFDKALDLLSPSPNASITYLPTTTGESIAVIDVEPSNELILADGELLVRRGAATVPMNLAELQERALISKPEDSVPALAAAVERQSQIIESLRQEIASGNSWQSKLRDHLVSGIIGAIIGAAVTAAGASLA